MLLAAAHEAWTGVHTLTDSRCDGLESQLQRGDSGTPVLYVMHRDATLKQLRAVATAAAGTPPHCVVHNELDTNNLESAFSVTFCSYVRTTPSLGTRHTEPWLIL